jgi:hypothetical protein
MLVAINEGRISGQAKPRKGAAHGEQACLQNVQTQNFFD